MRKGPCGLSEISSFATFSSLLNMVASWLLQGQSGLQGFVVAAPISWSKDVAIVLLAVKKGHRVEAGNCRDYDRDAPGTSRGLAAQKCETFVEEFETTQQQ